MESPSISQELDNELQTEVLSPSSSMADTIIKPISRTTVNFVMGKHRMAAAIASLDQQIHFIQEEMEQLESYGEASVVCKEFLSIVESKPDALLPVLVGGWDLNERF
ncbi:guanine nucleotide-binding protein subunit gamma 2-like isoform X2 [Nicotiana tabacum]|uniref:Guanine nucleotide-binding protein subunit gamma 2-like isoform X2 n=1 Tax=Nicotiana tabacum TaxID=4097 RepID=A0A1S4DCE7_TOBAC|nr:PREDICTED: guanine nucleotide-binding protein subunit gamma 2-like isoform X2 [Nicotiana tabacum]